MRLGNPALSRATRLSNESVSTPASYMGIGIKTIIYSLVTILTSIFAYIYVVTTPISTSAFYLTMSGCSILALIVGIACSFKPDATKVLGIIYTILQGVSLGLISALVSMYVDGVVFSALVSTFITFLVMATLYFTGIIRVGSKFRAFMFTALIAIIFSQLIIYIMSLFSTTIYTLFYGSGTLSIIISIVMVIFASLMLLVDFQNATTIVENGLDKKYEWVVAFGLIVTLIWIYIEFLELFVKLAARSKN